MELRPWNIDADAILGGASSSGAAERCRGQYRDALRLDPGHSASRVDLGLALARQGHSAEAITSCGRPSGVSPESRGPSDPCRVLATSGRIGEATPEFKRSSASVPNTPELACSWRGSEVTACEFGRSLRRTGRNGLGRWMGCVAARGSPLTRPSGPLSPLTRGEGEGRPRHETGMDARLADDRTPSCP